MNLSHLNERNQPTMVNVCDKRPTRRAARARAVVTFPPDVAARFQDGELVLPKGPVFQTAILAGIMGAKQTGNLIPLCHPIGLEDCRIDIRLSEAGHAVIECTAEIVHKTGVEMEALTGASIAALTIYDMCKSLSHDIRIAGIELVEKTGGKADFHRTEPTD